MFVAVLFLQLCRGGCFTFAQGGDASTSSPAAALFYAGEIPAVSYPNSRGGELQVISFQRGESPGFQLKQRWKPGEEPDTPNAPNRRIGAFLDKCRG